MNQKTEKEFDKKFVIKSVLGKCINDPDGDADERIKSFIDKHFIDKRELVPPENAEITCICGKCDIPIFYTKSQVLEIIGEDMEEPTQKELDTHHENCQCYRNRHGYKERGADARSRLEKL